MRAAFVLSLPLLLAACESREPVSICAAVGDPAETVSAAFHGADGLRAVLISDAGARQVRIVRDTQGAPILERLWRTAEPTMRALPEVEPSPCGLDTLSAVTVTFSDGTSITRQTSCTGNALARVASEVLAASGMDRVADGAGDTVSRDPVGGIRDACERLP